MTTTAHDLFTPVGHETDVLLLGAAGHMGALIATELARRGLSVGLAGRDAGALTQLASRLPGSTETVTHVVDLADASSLARSLASARLVASTVGPFARWAEPVVAACLTAQVAYVDIANEWSALRQLIALDGQARGRGVALVTGAGFGVAATETLVLRLVAGAETTPTKVRVAGAPAVAVRSEGVAATIRAAMTEGAVTYRAGEAVREPLGAGATTVSFSGIQRRVFPAAVGDLEAARLASDALDVIAFVPEPTERGAGDSSYAWAEVTWPDGSVHAAELRLGDANLASAAIAAETAFRILTDGGAGVWTPCRRFGAGLLTDATAAEITLHAEPPVGVNTSEG